MKDPCNPLPGLTGEVLIERCGGSCKEGADLCSELSSCFSECTPSAAEWDYDAMYSNDGIHSFLYI
jgi:hypothetical protein